MMRLAAIAAFSVLSVLLVMAVLLYPAQAVWLPQLSGFALAPWWFAVAGLGSLAIAATLAMRMGFPQR